MLPAGTGPNALAWATGHCSMRSMIKAGFTLDIVGIFLLVGVVWAVANVA
jgi:sodium-dependent dicarboxylate transporter 2/3/5